MLTTGTPTTVPCSSAPSSSRISRVTAAIELYSQPWIPPMTLIRGAPCPTSKQGTSSPLRVIVVRTPRIQYVWRRDGCRPARPAPGADGRERARPRGRPGDRTRRGRRSAGGGRGTRAGVAQACDRRGVPRDRGARDAGARAEPRPDRRRRAQREREVVVRRGAGAADDRRAQALGEAPESLDRDLAVPAPRRAHAVAGGAREQRGERGG